MTDHAFFASLRDDDPLWDDARDAAYATTYAVAREVSGDFLARKGRRPTRDELLDALTERHYAALCAERAEARIESRLARSAA